MEKITNERKQHDVQDEMVKQKRNKEKVLVLVQKFQKLLLFFFL